jgi:hypothetical protein
MKKKILFCFAFYFVSLCVMDLSAQYCTTGGPSSVNDSNVESVSFPGDAGTSITYSGCPGITGVQNLTLSQNVTVTVNAPYTATIDFGTCGGNYGGAGEAWIDWNQNNIFDATESIGTWSGTPPAAPTAMGFIVPPTAIPGITRMRVMHQESGSNPLAPCGSFTWGSVVDFSVTVLSGAPITCPFPTTLSAVNVTSNSANLGWTENGTATSWAVQWGPQGFPVGGGVTIITGTNPYTLTGLPSNTDLAFYVRAICAPADSSYWIGPLGFKTLCSPVTNFPFWEGFNSTSTTQDCWTVVNDNADFDVWDMDYPFSPFEGDECATIRTDFNNGLNNDYLISPRLMLTGAERLHFKHRCQSTFEPNDYEVRLSTTGIAPADFTNLLLRDTSTAITYEEDSLDLFAFSGPCHVAFRIPPGGLDGWVLYIDDVLIERLTYNDAGVASLVNPVLPTAGGFTPLDVEVANYGVTSLNSFIVEWEVDGISQPAVAYTGLPLGIGESAIINLANLNLPISTTNLKFWTTMPNGVVDEDFENDTLNIDLCPGLAGTYTVGHSSSDFPTVEGALESLTTCGVAAPVIMQFQPGLYTGQWQITKIPGASAVNTVTFDGINSANAVLQHTGFGINGAPTLVLDGAEYFVMKNFTIRSTGINQAYGVLLINNANHNIIEGNIIEVPVSGSVSNVVAVLASASYTASTGAATQGNNSNWNLIKNNDITGGVSAIIFEGGETNTENIGNQIVGNRIHNAQSYGIYADEQDSFVVSGNTVYDILSTTSDAMMFFDIHNYSILSNDVTSKDFGIAIWGGFADPCTVGLIANNMVACLAAGEALYLRDAATINIYHNTLSAGRACWLDNQGNIDFRNNILTTVNGECFYTLDAVSMAGMDFNLYYVSGTAGDAVRFGTFTYATLLDWQTTGPTIYDDNSVSGDPGFVGGLHVAGSLAVDTGDVALTISILTDIDGEVRPMGTKPDIGADEHLIIADDAMVVGLVSPSGCGSDLTDVIVEIANLGSNQLISAPVLVNVSGAATATYSTTVPLLAGGSTLQVNMGTINTSAGGNFVFQLIINSGADLNPTNDTMIVPLYIAPSNQMAITTSGDALVCLGSRATLMAAASYAPATILWYDAPTGGNLLQVGTTYSTAPLAVAATTYYLEVQGCNSPRAMATVNADIVGINVDLGSDVTACGGGIAIITSTVTLSPSTDIVWSNGSRANFIHASAAGDYIATVVNANGCVDSDTVNITLSTVPTIANITSNVTCGGFSDGSVDITVTGSTYSYLWSNGATTQDINNLSGGFYAVTVIDNATASNCEYNESFQVLESGTMTTNVDVVGVACDGNGGFINISVLGGAPTYTFLWSDGQTDEDATGLGVGGYTVTVTDTNGCDLTATGTITATTPITITVDTIFDEILAVQGAINTTATGGTGALAYSWSNGATTANVTGLVAGTYSVTVTDLATGCQSVMGNIVIVYKIPDFVENIAALNHFKLYPNPTKNRVWIDLSLAETTTVQLDILTVTGQIIYSYTPREDLEQNYEIDMSQFASGVYLARFVIGSEVMTTKVVVE